jgi:hypothetical protein
MKATNLDLTNLDLRLVIVGVARPQRIFRWQIGYVPKSA